MYCLLKFMVSAVAYAILAVRHLPADTACVIFRLSTKGKAIDLSSLDSLEKRAAQVELEPATYQLLSRYSTN